MILDEPTSSLTEHETELLFNVIRQLATDGVPVIYISHRLEEIARIADLSVFRVEARLSDAYADRIASGQPVRIQVGEELLPGRVQSVYPAVEAGVVRLLLELDAGDHPRLRPNLRVEAHLFVQERTAALKVKRGVFVSADGRPAPSAEDTPWLKSQLATQHCRSVRLAGRLQC